MLAEAKERRWISRFAVRTQVKVIKLRGRLSLGEPVDRLRGTMEDMLNAGDNRLVLGSGRAGHSRFQRDWTANAFFLPLLNNGAARSNWSIPPNLLCRP